MPAPELIRSTGLLADGPAQLGRRVPASGPGIYVVELAVASPTAPIDLARIGSWIERVPGLRLDGERPNPKALAARLASFWLPGQTVLFIGATDGSIGGRLAALDRHVLGDPRPHAASQWLKTLAIGGLRVWWAATDAAEEYEDALLAAFIASVPDAERRALHDPDQPLPFANLRTPTGERKRHGLTGQVLPIERPAEAPPRRRILLPPGDADGIPAPSTTTGTIRRGPAPARSAMPRGTSRSRATGRRASAAPAASFRAASEPVYLSAEGLDRLRSEHADLTRVQRPGVVARIRAAKELGDLRENSDYHAAREEQSFLEGRIQAIEAQLRAAVVMGAPADASRVGLGSRVTVEHDGETAVLSIVGTTESDPSAGRISHASPVGRALLGKSAGEIAEITTPGGQVSYRIVGIE